MAGACLPIWGAVVTLVAFLIGFATYVLPYWTEQIERVAVIKDGKMEYTLGDRLSVFGFWANCDLKNNTGSMELSACQWYFQDNFQLEDTFDPWLKACQGVMGFALLFEFFMLVTMNIRPWCCPDTPGISILIGIHQLFIFIGKVATMIIFGKNADLGGLPDVFLIPGAAERMGFCPYLSIVGAGMSLLGSAAYFAHGCKGRQTK